MSVLRGLLLLPGPTGTCQEGNGIFIDCHVICREIELKFYDLINRSRLRAHDLIIFFSPDTTRGTTFVPLKDAPPPPTPTPQLKKDDVVFINIIIILEDFIRDVYQVYQSMAFKDGRPVVRPSIEPSFDPTNIDVTRRACETTNRCSPRWFFLR
jgi:hypothetical protein